MHVKQPVSVALYTGFRERGGEGEKERRRERGRKGGRGGEKEGEKEGKKRRQVTSLCLPM